MTFQPERPRMKQRKVPERTCVACRTSSDKAALIRVVRSADGAVRVDSTGKLPGRGAYLCRSAECAAKAMKRKGMDRALRAQVPPTLAEDLKRSIEALVDNSE